MIKASASANAEAMGRSRILGSLHETPVPEKPVADAANQQAADQSQMRGMAGHRQTRHRRHHANAGRAQPDGVKQQQIRAQRYQRGHAIGLDLADIPGDAGQKR